MITVTTADSKYSRHTDFGGPLGFVSTGAWPCHCVGKSLKKKTALFRFRFDVAFFAATAGRLLLIYKIILDTLPANGQVWLALVSKSNYKVCVSSRIHTDTSRLLSLAPARCRSGFRNG